ncbi:MAG: hypothetical protein NXH75_13780, partial [Halobacteriovoraceae bacterium]|nr:hypothetical protein [Halobacteriovoraceae bacterium]
MEKNTLVFKTKKFLLLKLMTLSFVLAFGCAPKPKKSEAKLNLVSSMAIADINMNGGAIVYGQQQDGKGRWAKIFRPGDNVVVDMAQGVWNFSVVAYSGPTQLSGIRECGVLNKINIAEEKEVIDVFISAGECSKAGVRGLEIKRCTQAEF